MVCYKSKAFHTRFKQQNLESLKEFIEHDRDTVRTLLRGLFDSEGSNHECVQIELGNTELELLCYAQHLLSRYFGIVAIGTYLRRRAGIIKGILKDGKIELIKTEHDAYEIAISRKLQVMRFLNEIGFSITRRQFGFPVKRKRRASPHQINK